MSLLNPADAAWNTVIFFFNLTAATGRFDLPMGMIILSTTPPPFTPNPAPPPPTLPSLSPPYRHWTRWHSSTASVKLSALSLNLRSLELFCVGHACVSTAAPSAAAQHLAVAATTANMARISQTRKATRRDAAERLVY